MEKKSRGIVKVWAEGIELKSKRIRLKVRCRLQGNKGNQERAVLTGLKGSLGLPPKKKEKKKKLIHAKMQKYYMISWPQLCEKKVNCNH